MTVVDFIDPTSRMQIAARLAAAIIHAKYAGTPKACPPDEAAETFRQVFVALRDEVMDHAA